MAHIIVVGNEKGGSGKSTTGMHVGTALARMGFRVGALDLDLRQRSFGRYIENRRAWMARAEKDLPTPDYRELPEVDVATLAPGENAFDHRLSVAVSALEPISDFIVIDCPGSHTRASQVAHSLAALAGHVTVTLVAPRCSSMRMSAATGEAGVGIGKGKNAGVGVVAGATFFASLATVPGSISAPTSASLTHRRTRFALTPLAMATEADDTPGREHAATMCALKSAL